MKYTATYYTKLNWIEWMSNIDIIVLSYKRTINIKAYYLWYIIIDCVLLFICTIGSVQTFSCFSEWVI